MKYGDETINRLAYKTGFHVETVKQILELLESTDEQKKLRADAERWRHFCEFFGLANPEDGSITWHPEAIAAVIDKARES